MLHSLALRDFVIVQALEVDFSAGFSVLTGETGAGKSILIDALQLALGSRGDAGVVREGAVRAEVAARFQAGPVLRTWLQASGFEADEEVLLRRHIDKQGRSRAWINGASATLAQLREVADHLVDIHGQHAWQSLTRPSAVRALLDAYAGNPPEELASAWASWHKACQVLSQAQAQQRSLNQERERLEWQLRDMEELNPQVGEWESLNLEHSRLAHAQRILDAVRSALQGLSEADDSADSLTGRAIVALQDVADVDPALAPVAETLCSAQAQLQDVVHSLHAAVRRMELDPTRLSWLDDRLAAWIGLARRWRCSPEDLPHLRAQWLAECQALDAAADGAALAREVERTEAVFNRVAREVSARRKAAAQGLAREVSQVMQSLGMTGGQFDVALPPCEVPQAFGWESVEFLVAGHAGVPPRPLIKVASGGELSRMALAVAVTTSRLAGAGTLIFDEVDTGVGGAVAEAVGQLMRQLGQDRQVLAVTHLPQVAACADHHFVVSKTTADGITSSEVRPVIQEVRVTELARMLGGYKQTDTSLAHAREMLDTLAVARVRKTRSRKRMPT